MPKMWNILDEIIEKTGFDEHRILILSLYGSQNYRMDNENSDIDTECFIFPSKDNLIYADPLFSKCIQTSYGTCHVKDIRAAFNELRKCSPNMLEIFASPYMIINQIYYFIINEICSHEINFIASLNPYKSMPGFEGLYNKYRKDMMTSNKAYANMLRIENMMTSILHHEDYTNELIPHNYPALQQIKYANRVNLDVREVTESGYSQVLRKNIEIFYAFTSVKDNENVLNIINDWQQELMIRYIKLVF